LKSVLRLVGARQLRRLLRRPCLQTEQELLKQGKHILLSCYHTKLFQKFPRLTKSQSLKRAVPKDGYLRTSALAISLTPNADRKVVYESKAEPEEEPEVESEGEEDFQLEVVSIGFESNDQKAG
jgi:hypothetical protein